MNFNELVSRLEADRNWEALATTLRDRAKVAASPEEIAQAQLALGKLLEERLCDKIEALRAYESAYRAHAGCTEALVRAREVFRFLGKLPQAVRTLELEIKSGTTDAAGTAALLVTLGDIQWDAGDPGAAAVSYARALEIMPGHPEATERMEDVQTSDPVGRASALATAAQEADPATAAQRLLRAARTVRSSDPKQCEAYLIQAFALDPLDETIALLLESVLTEAGRTTELITHQDTLLAQAPNPSFAGILAERFGLRWLYRLGDPARGIALLERALQLDATRESSFEVLKRYYGEQGQWDRVVGLADSALARAADGAEVYYLSQAGKILLERVQHVERAKVYFDRLSRLAPEHSTIRAWVSVAMTDREPSAGTSSMTSETVAKRPAPDPAKLAALDEQVAKFEAQKRWADVVKTLAQKADLMADDAERVAVLERIAKIHIERTNNVAEAIKAYEAVLELQPDHAQAVEFLKARYEQRRDWEKLLGILRREAQTAPEEQQFELYLSMARMASEKIKKPEVCIELWEQVLARDPSNTEALAQLAGFYERAREFGKLAHVLREQAAQTADVGARIALLVKLGTIAGDKLNDDALAVEAWRGVLALDPNDRRAQEALKKRYLAMHAWDELEFFYAESGKWDELIRLLEREADNPQATSETKIGLFFKIAQLWAERKEKSDRAARYYEKVLEIEPTHREAAIRLIPIYAAANDAKKLAGVYEVKLQGDTSPDERVETLRALGELYETKLKEPTRAFERFRDAFITAPEEPRSVEDLERTAGNTQRWAEAAEVIEHALDNVTSTEAAVTLRLRLGRLFAHPLQQIDRAIAVYRQVLDLDGGNMDALAALEDLFRQTGRARELLEVLEKRLELSATPEERRANLYAIAQLSETDLNDPQRAVDTYNAILAEFGDENPALQRLDALFDKLERWEELAQILERELVLLGQDETASLDVKYRLGRVLEQHLGKTREAIEHYREILALNPEHLQARTALEALLRDPELRGEAARILEPIYEMRGDWEALIRSLEILLADETDIDTRIAWLRKIGDVCVSQLGDGIRAFEAYGRALLEDPSRTEVREALEALAEPISAWPRLVSLLQGIADSTSDPGLARALWMKIAEIEDTRQGNVDAAVAAYHKVLAQDPGDAEALAALEALFRRTQRWGDLLAVYRKRLDLTGDPAVREELLDAIARTYDEHLSDAESAIRTYREMLEANPVSPRALEALDGLFARLERWSDLADNLQVRLEAAQDPDEQTALMLRLARLREEKMGEVETAVEIYRQILERDSSNADALAALQRLIEQPAYALMVAEILEPVYRDNGAYDLLVATHEIQVRHTTDAARRVELLHRIAELQETALDDPGAAFQTLARALAEDPAHEETVAGLERLARALQNYDELAAVYEARIAEAPSIELKLALHQRAAIVHEECLGNVEGAVAHYRAMLDLDPRHLDAVTALERLYQLTEQWENLAEIYLTKATLLDSPDEAKAYLFRASEIYESVLERPQRAVEVFRRILEIDPEEMNAIDALIRLFITDARWEDLLAIYERKIDLVTDPDEKKKLHFEVASVYEGELKDIPKAIDAYNKVRELDPDDLVAIQRLDHLYLSQGNWVELLSILEREADLASDPSEICGYRYRIAELHEKHLGDIARAVDIYREILDVLPDHQPSLSALEAILHGDKEPLAAAAVLEPVYTAAGAYEKLVDVLEVQLAHASEDSQRVELLHRIADIYEQALDNPRAAFDAYARALPFDPLNDTTLGNLEKLADVTDRWQDLVRVYDQQIARLEGSAEQQVELALRTAQIYEVRLGDVESAIEHYKKVLAVDDRNATAIQSLDRLYESSQRWAELAQILRKEIELPELSPDDVTALRFRLGQILEQALGDVDGALSVYREILDAQPDHGPTVSALESMFQRQLRQPEVAAMLAPIYESQGDWEKLAQLREASLGFITDPAERLAVMHGLAELFEEKLSDAVGAFHWYARALRESPLDERSLTEVERLAGATGAWADLASTYADVVEASQQDEVKQLLGKKLARIYEEELADIENAEAAYNYVLSVAPLDPEALERLDAIYTGMGNAERLAQVLDRRIQVTEDGIQKVELTFRLAQILENDLQQAEQAILRYRTIVEHLDPRHEDSLRALERLYTEAERWPQLFEIYQKQLEIAYGDTERAEILARMATLAGGVLQQPDEAVRLWNEVLSLRGEDPEALDALAALHEAAGRYQDLIDVLERRLVSTDDYEQKALIALRIPQVYENALGDLDRAIEGYRRVLDIDSNSLEALRALARIYRQSQNWDELVAVLQTQIQVGAATLEGAELKELWVELGNLFQHTLQQPFDAVDAWRHVLEIDPTDEGALDALLAIHTAQEEWRDVVDVLNMKANAASIDEAKIPLLLQAASVWEERIGERDGAREAYEKILAIDPLHEHAFRALEQLHIENERWEPLIEMYIARHDALDESEVRERVDLLRRAARVYDEKQNDTEQAFAAALLAYEEDVSDPETVALLERLATVGAKWNELMQTVTEWWKTAEGDRWVHIGLNMAKWYGIELNHPEWAIPIYQQVLARDPDNLLALHSMTALYRKTQQWPQLAQLLERCIVVARNEADRRKLHVELGEVLEQHLGNVDAAVEHYRTALNLDSKDIDALSALERVYETREDWPSLVEVLERKIEALTEPAEIADVGLKIGEILEDRVGDADRAVAAYHKVLEVEPGNLQALRGLERLYARMERPQELFEVLEAELNVVSSERERIKLLTRLAEMLEEEFVRLPEAAQRFEQVVEIDPNNDHALRGLERLYRRQGMWHELIHTLDRHISATPERQERVPLFYAMGTVYAQELNDLDRAADAFQNALDIDPQHVPSLEELSKVFERQGDWHRAVETLETLSNLVSDPAKSVEIRHRIGKVAEEQLGDEERALELYRSALDVDPNYLPALASIRAIYMRREDWHGATRYLEREIEATEQPRAKAKLYFELGRIWNEQLDERERAVACFEAAIQNDPDNEDAAYPLVFHYVSVEKWAEAEPLAEMLVRKASRRDPAEQLQLQFIMGRVAARLGKLDRAIKALTAAHALDRSNVEVLTELARAYFDKRDWENAFKCYHLLLVHHKDDLDAEGRADLYYRLGVIKREQGDRRRAINFLDKALEEVPNHRPTLEALVDTYAQNNEWEQVIGYKGQILENHVFDKEERYKMLLEIGALWQEKARNPHKAIQSYTEALDLKPEDHALMHKLLALYQETKQWSKVIEMVQRISEIEKDPVKKSRYAYTIASIYNAEIKNPDEAVYWYNVALDLNPKELKPFARINEILTAKKDFKQLERSFRKMIHRIVGKGEHELEFNLWHNLGVIYRDRLSNMESAIAAFKMASQIKPEDPTEHRILAELYTATHQPAEAVAQWMKILETEINNADALSALYDLHYQTREFDKAWCVAATMTFLLRDRAREDARAFYEQYKPRRPIAPQARLDEERWIKDLFHPNEDPFVGKIFASILPALRRAKVQPVQRFGLTDRERQDPASSSVALVRAMGLAGAALNLPLMPLIYLRPQQPGGLAYVPSEPWASVAGAGLLQGLSPTELQFVAAKHMCYYRPEHYVRVLFPTVAELTSLLLAAIKIVTPDFEVPAEIMPTVQTLGQQMAQDPIHLEGLRKVVRLFMDQGGQVNIKKWFQAVELTACRAGFLLSGDLEVTKKMLALEPGLPGDVSPNDKLKDVVLFSISDSYFRLREALGITFQQVAAY